MRHQEEKEVRVARINARQAIVVAVISALTGFGATLLGTGVLWRQPETNPMIIEPVAQKWLTVMEVGFLDTSFPGELEGVRAILEVNGRAISYPSRVLTAMPGVGMSNETFALETDSEYAVRAEVLAIGVGGGVSRYASQVVEVFQESQLPVEFTYYVYGISSTMSRAPTPSIWVRFRISENPE